MMNRRRWTGLVRLIEHSFTGSHLSKKQNSDHQTLQLELSLNILYIVRFKIQFSRKGSGFYCAHLLKLLIVGKVSCEEGDSGTMSAHARMLSPSISSTALWTTADTWTMNFHGTASGPFKRLPLPNPFITFLIFFCLLLFPTYANTLFIISWDILVVYFLIICYMLKKIYKSKWLVKEQHYSETWILTTAWYTEKKTAALVYLSCLQRAAGCCQWGAVSQSGWLGRLWRTPPPPHSSEGSMANSWSSEGVKERKSG